MLCCINRQNKEWKFDYILFGTFAGYCIGEQCIEIYKIQTSKLFEDTADTYPNLTPNPLRKYVLLEDSIYQKIKNFQDSIPLEILNEPSKTFGCPDCADGGGNYIKLYFKNGQTKEFLIDRSYTNSMSAMPIYATKLTIQIEQAVYKINH